MNTQTFSSLVGIDVIYTSFLFWRLVLESQYILILVGLCFKHTLIPRILNVSLVLQVIIDMYPISNLLTSDPVSNSFAFLPGEVKNILFLHCFYDSPNHNFDPTRIFYDYIEWISRTLEIISRDDQPWIVRSHPDAYFFGEDTYKLLCSYKGIRKLLVSENIHFEYGHIAKAPSLDSFLKILTYSGTVAEEAVLVRRRPVTIAQTFISQLFPNLCFKPSSLSEYEELLLSDCSQMFLLHQDSILAFKTYLQNLSDIVPPELKFSVINGSIQYCGELLPNQIDTYLDIMSDIQDV